MEIIKLNLIPCGVNPTCHAKQYDKGRIIRFELFNGLTPYTLQSGDTVTLNLRKPDNTIIESSVTATEGNKYVDLVTTEQMCAVAGYNLGTFKIVNGEDDIGTLNFIMAVEKDVLADGIASQSVIEDLNALVAEAVGDDFYNKSEIDNKVSDLEDEIDTVSGKMPLKYGIRWSINDPDDLGARCFDAVGMNASIGIGSTSGSSDFDTVYPWSEMKRCNIKSNANGAKIVTFEGETGFALDGTNGDVFVRIPKFYIEKYQKNGYEYRVISATGTTIHPLFIEDGNELDEVFISAFEGYLDGNGKMRSIGGVIPTSNLTPQDFLTAAQGNGENYSLYDMRCVDAVWTLLAVEFGCRNTNQVLGYGIADFEQPATYSSKDIIILSASNTNTVRTAKWTASQKTLLPLGSNITVCDTTQQNILTQAKITGCVDGDNYTDWTFDGDPIDVTTDCFIGAAPFNTNWSENSPSGALSWHTGRNNWITTKADTKNAVRYRWIENVVGNLWHCLPDVTFNGLQMYLCKDMKNYVMHKYTDTYKPVGALFIENDDNGNKADVTGANYWITSLDNNIFAKGVLFGRTYDKSLLSTKAFGGYYYLKSTNVIIANGGGFDHLYRCNMLTQRAWIAPTQQSYLYGARLMYKNVS